MWELKKNHEMLIVWTIIYSISGPARVSNKVDSFEANNPEIVCFGEMLIDFVPTINGVSLADAPAFKKAPGGAPANVAVGVARLGGSAAFIGKVSPIIHYYFW